MRRLCDFNFVDGDDCGKGACCGFVEKGRQYVNIR